MNRAADVLDQAALYIEAGWCRGIMQDTHGNKCAMGAISTAAVLDLAARDTAATALAQVLCEQYNVADTVPIGPIPANTYLPGYASAQRDFDTIIRCNDQLARDGDEIIACMHKAAQRLREAI